MKNNRKKSNPGKNLKPVAIWLYVCCAMIFIMALVGAITRLTGSGLSIAEWKPIMGALPPLHEAEWQRVFDLYKQTPEFQKVNSWMALGDFKRIFFWEWLHRLWGRLIGAVYAVPFFWFLLSKRLPRVLMPSFLMPLILGGAQGFMGWYMVQSGLIDEPAVSHYRLAAHLGLALLIYGLIFHLALRISVTQTEEAAQLAPLSKPVHRALFLVVVTMTWGAFTAGLDAGMLYNEFPLMGNYPWPPELSSWRSIFHEPASVQFTHRVLAVTTVFYILLLYAKTRSFHLEPRIARLFSALAVMAVVQATLGISTLLTGVALPLAVAHQAGGIIVLSLLIWLVYEIPHEKFSHPKKG